MVGCGLRAGVGGLDCFGCEFAVIFRVGGLLIVVVCWVLRVLLGLIWWFWLFIWLVGFGLYFLDLVGLV